jgi:hypothetical protein
MNGGIFPESSMGNKPQRHEDTKVAGLSEKSWLITFVSSCFRGDSTLDSNRTLAGPTTKINFP